MASPNGVSTLLALEVAQRTDCALHEAPDNDGVHLSWMGLLTTEGNVTPLPELGPQLVTMLLYWQSERTLWLNDVFGVPEPLPAPWTNQGLDNRHGKQAERVESRQELDRAALTTMLGRDPFTTRS
jgi:hypothetical protein